MKKEVLHELPDKIEMKYNAECFTIRALNEPGFLIYCASSRNMVSKEMV